MKQALTGLALAVFLAGGAFAQEDEQLAALILGEQVKAVLLEKGGDRAVPIVVTMDRNTAILTGTVETKAVQELAAEVARSVDGVKKVDNRLRVTGQKKASQLSPAESAAHQAQELADASLETDVKIALFKEIGTKARHLEIEAVRGVVSVRGTLSDAARKQIALETVAKHKEVKQVVDLIKIGG